MFVFLLAIGSSPALMEKFEAHFPTPTYGDLYMLSNMPGYRIKNDKKVKPIITHNDSEATLTIIGDSYTQHFDSSYFNVNDYRFIHWNNIPATVPAIDKNKKNILIIESAERFIRWRFTKNKLVSIRSKNSVPNAESEPINLLAENNLQYLFTNYNWELSFKELKTAINLNAFDKFSPMVQKPDGSGRLYLSETIQPDNNASSFIKIPDAEIKDLVTNLNTVSNELKKIGFDEVYISIIPNAATIYKSSDLPYNQLIERIQTNPTVQFKFIELLQPFKKEQHSVFLCNDSHWNELGKMIWLIQVNTIIDKGYQPRQ
jgi:hypothetical protein